LDSRFRGNDRQAVNVPTPEHWNEKKQNPSKTRQDLEIKKCDIVKTTIGKWKFVSAKPNEKRPYKFSVMKITRTSEARRMSERSEFTS